jgi:hypothetical protein
MIICRRDGRAGGGWDQLIVVPLTRLGSNVADGCEITTGCTGMPGKNGPCLNEMMEAPLVVVPSG